MYDNKSTIKLPLYVRKSYLLLDVQGVSFNIKKLICLRQKECKTLKPEMIPGYENARGNISSFRWMIPAYTHAHTCVCAL